MDAVTLEYLAGLPDVQTRRLPKGALFWAEGRLYEVSEVDAGGYHKARLWRQSEHTQVALVPESLLSRHLPVVPRGHLLPVYHSQQDLTDGGACTCYVFPTETLALDAAYLDVALIQRCGPYVRAQDTAPAFAATDGIHIFRLYYYRQSIHGRPTDLTSLRDRSTGLRPYRHTDGPGYWRLLPSWTEHLGAVDETQQSMRSVPPGLLNGDTLPHTPRETPPA